jgi:hypothetical protein
VGAIKYEPLKTLKERKMPMNETEVWTVDCPWWCNGLHPEETPPRTSHTSVSSLLDYSENGVVLLRRHVRWVSPGETYLHVFMGLVGECQIKMSDDETLKDFENRAATEFRAYEVRLGKAIETNKKNRTQKEKQ